jgi:hypothetical protein
MDARIGQLKTDFNAIVNVRGNVMNTFDLLLQRIEKLKTLYSEFIVNNENQLFIFGLDSFRFQGKLIDIEFEDMRRIFRSINNRMYCEYFKLYRIVVGYATETIHDKRVLEVIKLNDYPIYKDLEPFKEYEFDIIIELHENSLILLSAIVNYVETKENELAVYEKQRVTGLNIDNFVTSFRYDITMMKEKVNLFLTYLEFFHKLHSKYLRRFSHKIQLMQSHVDTDIRFDEKPDIMREISAESTLLTEMRNELDGTDSIGEDLEFIEAQTKNQKKRSKKKKN